MAVSKDDILEAISNMTVVEVVDLIEAMEEKFGVSAAAAVAAAPAVHHWRPRRPCRRHRLRHLRAALETPARRPDPCGRRSPGRIIGKQRRRRFDGDGNGRKL